MSKFINYLKNNIDEQAKLEIEQINYEIKSIHDKEISCYEDECVNDHNYIYENKIKKIKDNEIFQISKIENFYRNELLNLRKELLNPLYIKLKERLIDFKNSKNYVEFIQKRLSLIQEKGTIYIKSEDELLFTTLIDSDFEIKFINLEIGGFIFRDNNSNEYDFTLDTKYLETLNSFKSNKELIIW